MARTVCELLEWRRPSGRLKNHECRQLLERLQAEEFLKLPALRKWAGEVRGGQPLGVVRRAQRRGRHRKRIYAAGVAPGGRRSREPPWREKVDRYHYLGCRVPFGANLRYWVRYRDRELACLLWNSPAWKMQARDAWIGWSEATATAQPATDRQQRPISDFAGGARQRTRQQDPGAECTANAARLGEPLRVSSVLLETLVDAARFRGTCYRAANWIPVGQTAGRGRMDRDHRGHGQAVKDIYVYPLVHDARQRLCRNLTR